MRRLYTTEPKRMAQINNVLLSVRAPVGDINVAIEKCCIGRGLASISSKNNHNSFIVYLLKHLKLQFDMYNGEGTVFGSINKDTLNNIKIIIPSNILLDKFEMLTENQEKLIFNNFLESQRLAAIRDALVPKLMSGEIKVIC